MTYVVTGMAAMVELCRQSDVENLEKAESVMDKFTESFRRKEFPYGRVCGTNWYPEQLCLTVVKRDRGMVGYRNVKR